MDVTKLKELLSQFNESGSLGDLIPWMEEVNNLLERVPESGEYQLKYVKFQDAVTVAAGEVVESPTIQGTPDVAPPGWYDEQDDLPEPLTPESFRDNLRKLADAAYTPAPAEVFYKNPTPGPQVPQRVLPRSPREEKEAERKKQKERETERLYQEMVEEQYRRKYGTPPKSPGQAAAPKTPWWAKGTPGPAPFRRPPPPEYRPPAPQSPARPRPRGG